MNENEKNPAAENAAAGNGNTNFIHEIINADIAAGKCLHVVTRFPPEPNGYLHIGHAKAICLDYGTAKKYGGTFHLRFDDTNPVKEDTEYVESIMEDVRWLGAEWGEHLYYASDYFEKFYEYACKLIRDGKAYVCELYIQQIGTPQEVFNHPYNLFVAEFIGSPKMNIFDAKLKKVDGKYAVELDGYTVVLSDEKQEKLSANNVAEQEIKLGVRPEHITLEAAGVNAQVDVSEMMGSSIHLHVSACGQDVVVIVNTMNMTGSEIAELKTGKAVNFAFGGNNCHVFNKETGINLEA